ncbi:MAG: hypothetical protein C0478_13375 [Planctomyces sp.]|nr:hypothetical protein [Planctomyces sp.]
MYGDPDIVELPDGSLGLCQWLPEHPHPFKTADFDDSAEPMINVDPANFGGYQNIHNIAQEIRSIDPELNYSVGIYERRSLIPDPEVVFQLGTVVSGSWFGIRVAKATADVMEPRLKRMLDVICDTIVKTAQCAIPHTRPITYIVKVNGTPNVDLIVRTRDANLAIRAFAGDFSQVEKDIATLHRRFNAEMIQFLLNERGEWEFNFLLTADGKSIGTKTAFTRRDVLLREMELKVKKKV